MQHICRAQFSFVMKSEEATELENLPVPVEKKSHEVSARALKRNRCIGRFIGRCVRWLGATLRVTWLGKEQLCAVQKRGENGGHGGIFSVWHGQLLLPSLALRDRDYVGLVSSSADGEIAASALESLGWQTRRGSGTWNSIGATRDLLRALRDGKIVGITPDGPQGPSRIAAIGAVRIAKNLNCEMWPIGVAAQGLHFKTWDQMIVPRPFSRVVIVADKPFDPAQSSTLEVAMWHAENRAQAELKRLQQRDANRRATVAFNALLAPFLPALWGYTQWRREVRGKSAASTRGMWGHIPRSTVRDLRPDDMDKNTPVIWMHAVSVGEAMAARIVARALRNEMPNARLGLSVTTDTGMETARAGQKAGDFDAVWFYPIDAPVAVRRALNQIRPQVFLTLETELWPNFLAECQARGIQTFLVNGRVSDRLLSSAPRLRRFYRWMLGNFDALLMRSPEDAARLKTAFGRVANVQVAGDVKLDAAPESCAEDERKHWRQTLKVEENARLWVAGSTHDGEELIVARVWKRACDGTDATNAPLRLLIAPRHIERAPQVLAALREAGFKAVLRSQLNDESSPQVLAVAIVVLDTIGELAQIYSACDVVFVGGSLIERGGHNLLEPVLRGAPVLFGPHVMNFRGAAQLVAGHHLGQCVRDEDDLYQVLAHWLHDESATVDFEARMNAAVGEHRGAARRVAQTVRAAVENRARLS